MKPFQFTSKSDLKYMVIAAIVIAISLFLLWSSRNRKENSAASTGISVSDSTGKK